MAKNNNSEPIDLEIQDQDPHDATWIPVTSTANFQYFYKYTGGDDGKGGIEVSNNGNKGPCLAHVRLKHRNRYKIIACNFNDDTYEQLSWKQRANDVGLILNWNDNAQEAYYGIIVKDTKKEAKNGLIVCDPGINNKPLPIVNVP